MLNKSVSDQKILKILPMHIESIEGWSSDLKQLVKKLNDPHQRKDNLH